MTTPVRILFLSDTHLGFDDTSRPRIQRRRRGPEFFENYLRALAPARDGNVDIVIHGGDLFYRSRVPDSLVERALAPLVDLAEAGIPVFVVPGNHERSTIPQTLFTQHPLLHIFGTPATRDVVVRNTRIAVGGIPHVRGGIRSRFKRLLDATGLLASRASHRLLCLHEIVEGAQVEGHTFRKGEQVIRAGDIPGGLDAVLCGHIHRRQTLTVDLQGRPLRCPVLYPGSVERTSFAERKEAKGYLMLSLGEGAPLHVQAVTLPTRPMVMLTITASEHSDLAAAVADELSGLPRDAIVRVRIDGQATIAAAKLRSLAPATMTVSLDRPRLSEA